MDRMTQQSHDYDPREAEPTPGAQLQPAQEQPTAREGQPPPDAARGGAGVPLNPERSAPAGTPTGVPGIEERHVTRAGMVWAAVATALAVMVLLIVFILQNQDYVQVRFFGLEGAVSLGIALFIAAVGGGVLVAIAGAARIIQLRAAAHRRRVLAQRLR
jgi:uncharacterized integral membrane protein